MIPAQPVSFWQYFDLYTLSILALVIGALCLHHKRKYGSLLSTVSETLAHSRSSSLIFSITMTVCYPLYYAFIWFWVAPLLHMPGWFYALLVISAICEAIFVWVPAGKGRQKLIHQLAAGLVGVLLVIIAISILLAGDNLSTAGIFSSLIFLISTVVIGYIMLDRKNRRHMFMFELVYMILFLVMISFIAHS